MKYATAVHADMAVRPVFKTQPIYWPNRCPSSSRVSSVQVSLVGPMWTWLCAFYRPVAGGGMQVAAAAAAAAAIDSLIYYIIMLSAPPSTQRRRLLQVSSDSTVERRRPTGFFAGSSRRNGCASVASTAASHCVIAVNTPQRRYSCCVGHSVFV